MCIASETKSMYTIFQACQCVQWAKRLPEITQRMIELLQVCLVEQSIGRINSQVLFTSNYEECQENRCKKAEERGLQ